MKSLLIVNDFPPILGGQSTYYHYLARAFALGTLTVLAPCVGNDKEFDGKQIFKVIRRPYLISLPVLEKIFKIVYEK